MSAAESIKSHLGRLFGSDKTAVVLRFSVTMLLVFLVARTGADLSWQLGASFLSKGRSATPGQLPTQISPASSQTSRNSLPAPAEEIALFGLATAVLTAPGNQIEAAPATALNLILKGIVAVRPMRRALAVIAERGSPIEKLYGHGEELPGNAVIREIHPDRIIISRNGVLETLVLDGLLKSTPDRASSPSPARASSTVEGIQPRGDGTNWAINRSYWEEKLADVPGLAREVGMEVYSENSQQKGYRLVAVQGNKLLTDLGLQQGDILLSVNGRAMNNVQAGLAAYQQLKSSKQVTIEINRGGRRETRVYNIGG